MEPYVSFALVVPPAREPERVDELLLYAGTSRELPGHFTHAAEVLRQRDLTPRERRLVTLGLVVLRLIFGQRTRSIHSNRRHDHQAIPLRVLLDTTSMFQQDIDGALDVEIRRQRLKCLQQPARRRPAVTSFGLQSGDSRRQSRVESGALRTIARGKQLRVQSKTEPRSTKRVSRVRRDKLRQTSVGDIFYRISAQRSPAERVRTTICRWHDDRIAGPHLVRAYDPGLILAPPPEDLTNRATRGGSRGLDLRALDV